MKAGVGHSGQHMGMGGCCTPFMVGRCSPHLPAYRGGMSQGQAGSAHTPATCAFLTPTRLLLTTVHPRQPACTSSPCRPITFLTPTGQLLASCLQGQTAQRARVQLCQRPAQPCQRQRVAAPQLVTAASCCVTATSAVTDGASGGARPAAGAEQSGGGGTAGAHDVGRVLRPLAVHLWVWAGKVWGGRCERQSNLST